MPSESRWQLLALQPHPCQWIHEVSAVWSVEVGQHWKVLVALQIGEAGHDQRPQPASRRRTGQAAGRRVVRADGLSSRAAWDPAASGIPMLPTCPARRAQGRRTTRRDRFFPAPVRRSRRVPGQSDDDAGIRENTGDCRVGPLRRTLNSSTVTTANAGPCAKLVRSAAQIASPGTRASRTMPSTTTVAMHEQRRHGSSLRHVGQVLNTARSICQAASSWLGAALCEAPCSSSARAMLRFRRCTGGCQNCAVIQDRVDASICAPTRPVCTLETIHDGLRFRPAPGPGLRHDGDGPRRRTHICATRSPRLDAHGGR